MQQNRVRILRENAATRIQTETEIEQQNRLRVLQHNSATRNRRETQDKDINSSDVPQHSDHYIFERNCGKRQWRHFAGISR